VSQCCSPLAARDERAHPGGRHGQWRGDRRRGVLHGFTRRGGQLVCTYFDENFLNMVPAAQVEGLYGCLDYYQAVDDPFSLKLLGQYDPLYPGDAQFTGGSRCSGLSAGCGSGPLR
jgi:hypothetical protein